MINPSNKFYIILFFVLFIISTIILLISSTATAPAWGGYLDVGMWVYRDAFDFSILLLGVASRTYFSLSILPHATTSLQIGTHP